MCCCKHLGKHNFQLIVASSLLPIIPNCTSPHAHSNPDHFQMQIAALHSNLTQQRGESICIHKLAAIAISLKHTICIKSRKRNKMNQMYCVKFGKSNNEWLCLIFKKSLVSNGSYDISLCNNHCELAAKVHFCGIWQK